MGDDLVRQLLAYKQFKEVAKGLGQREADGLRSFIRLAPPPKIEVVPRGPDRRHRRGLADGSPARAGRGRAAAARRRRRQAVYHHHPRPDCADRADADECSRTSALSSCCGSRSRVEIVVTFLAVLELLKRRRIEVMQEQLFGEIIIQRGAEAVDATPILMDDAEFGEEEDGEEP